MAANPQSGGSSVRDISGRAIHSVAIDSRHVEEHTTAAPADSLKPDRHNAGDQADAFTSRFEQSRTKFWLIALSIIGNRSEAEDILQDAALTGLSKYTSGVFEAGTNFDAWMGQITRFTALNALRKRGRSSPQRAYSGNADTPKGHTALEHDAKLQEALDRLDEMPRTCLMLRVVGGLPYAAIAEILSIPEGTAMSHVHRSQKALRIWLESHEASNVHRREKRDE